MTIFHNHHQHHQHHQQQHDGGTPSITFHNDLTTNPSERDDIRIKKGLLQLPFEVLVGDILAILPQSDLVCMARVCKSIHRLYQSDYLWQRKFFNEFQYRPHMTLKQLGGSGGWRRIYHAMDRVEVYTWGTNFDCRLGYGRTSRKVYESVPKRIRRLDGVGIVQLAPTGWGCHALDKHGNVWAWGRIMESNSVRSDAVPRMLKRPRNVVQLCAGREVILAKDANGQVWQWCRENKVIEIIFGGSDRDTASRIRNNNNDINYILNRNNNDNNDPVVQISAGRDICAVLTKSGRIFSWRLSQLNDGRHQHRIHVKYPVSLIDQGNEGYEAAMSDGDKFTQISAGSDYIVAVTSLEKVYIFRSLDSTHYHISLDSPQQQETFQFTQQRYPEEEYEDSIVIETGVDGSQQERVTDIRGRILGEGLFLPIFSEALTRTVTATYEEYDEWERRQRYHRHHPKFVSSSAPTLSSSLSSSSTSSIFQDPIDEACCLRLSSSSRPTTISANSENFAIHHSSGKVLWGKGNVQSDTLPIVIERLHSNVCQVAFGDHHQGLLTEDGQLRTWGSFSHGALGQGDLRCGSEVPTVVEGPLKNKIVIGIGMAGWQSACLAIDLSEEKEKKTSRGKEHIIDDGYYSLENTSGSSGSGSGSSSDSSDGEEWMSADNDPRKDKRDGEMYPHGRSTSTEETLTSSAPVAIPSSAASLRASSSSSSSSSYPTHYHISSSCTPTCMLLFSQPNNHRYGTLNTHSRPTHTKKRSSSLVERYTDNSVYRVHHNSSGNNSSSREESNWYRLAMTRLSPIMTVYEPLISTESNMKGRRFSVL